VIEFKLTTLAGFVLIPFALWNKTSFLAERVLGNVISSGVKLMVLAVIVGIGSTLFGSVTAEITPGDVTLEDAATVILASLALVALGIFGPGIAAGLVSGAPQLGAGAVVGTAAGVGAGAIAGGALAGGSMRAGAAATGGAIKAGASLSGGAATSFSLGKAASGANGWRATAAGVGAMVEAGARSFASGARSAASRAVAPVKRSFESGGRTAFSATGGTLGDVAAAPAATGGAPNWARQVQRQQLQRDASLAAASALRDGDRGGSGDGPRLKQDED
ncbi:type IV secretion system protein, partial [Hyphomonas chukchiensis]